MDIGQARGCILELAQRYFTKATVVFAKQSFAVKQKKPLVTLSFGSAIRPLNPPTKIVDGRPASFYPTTMMVQIDLYTIGRKIEIAKGITPVMENTAAEDLLAFVSFLNSEYVIQYCHNKDISIVVPNTVQDLTDLINDTNYEYRAMVEIELRFTTVAIGYTGTLDINSVKHSEIDEETGLPVAGGDIQADDVTGIIPEVVETTSGGGNTDMEADETGFFTNVAINDKLVKEEN